MTDPATPSATQPMPMPHALSSASARRAHDLALSSFSDLAVGELGDDVEMAEVTGVLLQQVGQDPLQ